MHVEPNYGEKDLQTLEDRFAGAEKEFQPTIESHSKPVDAAKNP